MQQILAEKDGDAFSGEVVKGTFLVFDLRGSTRRAERMGAKKFFPFLTELLADLSDLVHGLDGTLSKFTGDGFLAIFGCPDYSRTTAYNALLCATHIRAHIAVFNSLLPAGEEPVRFGIGIATGTVFRGNIGNIHRFDYTVIGDPVNLAARLEQLTKRFQKDILVDAKTVDLAAEGVTVERLGFSAVRGKARKVEILHLKSVAGKSPS